MYEPQIRAHVSRLWDSRLERRWSCLTLYALVFPEPCRVFLPKFEEGGFQQKRKCGKQCVARAWGLREREEVVQGHLAPQGYLAHNWGTTDSAYIQERALAWSLRERKEVIALYSEEGTYLRRIEFCSTQLWA